MLASGPDNTAALKPYLAGRSFDDCWGQYERDGYVLFPEILLPEQVEEFRRALQPFLQGDRRGRNEFEGVHSNRVYAMLGKDPLFAELVTHPLQLAFAERELGKSCLLSACLAVNLLPGETPQPWHHDDSHCGVPRPRPCWGVSTFWTLDAMTATNGATEVIPGSHLWPEMDPPGAVRNNDFSPHREPDSNADPDERGGPDRSGNQFEAVKVLLPAGSLMIAKGTLWHRGGANGSNQPRLIVTPQYCPGWMRPLETMLLAVPPQQAAALPQRVRELLGYSIHPPFMGFVDGVHPQRTLPPI